VQRAAADESSPVSFRRQLEQCREGEKERWSLGEPHNHDEKLGRVLISRKPQRTRPSTAAANSDSGRSNPRRFMAARASPCFVDGKARCGGGIRPYKGVGSIQNLENPEDSIPVSVSRSDTVQGRKKDRRGRRTLTSGPQLSARERERARMAVKREGERSRARAGTYWAGLPWAMGMARGLGRGEKKSRPGEGSRPRGRWTGPSVGKFSSFFFFFLFFYFSKIFF